MFVLMMAALLFPVRSVHADTDASESGKQSCSGFCVTLTEKEITAVTGLCVVIPCSFTTESVFIVNNIVWYKCEPAQQRCGDTDMIFHTNRFNRKVQSGFRGRVSLLEPDWRRKNNCSIIISDLKESDSGSYQLRVNGLFRGRTDGFTFSPRATVSVQGVSPRPTVRISDLNVGQLAHVSCSAPSLCLESDPEFTWMWSETGKNQSHITGNSTAFMIENVAAITQRYSSTLTFQPSAEHHDTNITCKINFRGNVTTEETVTLTVNYVEEVRITKNTSVKEGQTLNITCSVDSFPPSLVSWTKFSSYGVGNGTENNEQNDAERLEQSGTATLSISNVTAEDSGMYICTVKHLNDTLKKRVNVTVIYVREPWITGDTTVKEGDVLNLTCSTNSFPPSLISWTKLGFPDTDLHTDPGSATLIIPNVTAEHSGHYMCSTEHLNTTMTAHADVTVTWFSKILNPSGCKAELELLTCSCLSEGFPLPAITWPLLTNYTEYSTTVTVSKDVVNSTLSLTVKQHHPVAVECVSRHEHGEAREKLHICISSSDKDDPLKTVFTKFPWIETIVAFFTGIFLYATICCLVQKCRRKKQPSISNLDETLEMVTNPEDQLTHDGRAQKHPQNHSQDEAEYEYVVGRELHLRGEAADVEYANIDFSLLKRKSAATNQERTETEYSEVKKHREDDGKEDEQMEGKDAVMEEEEEMEHCITDEGEGEEEDEDVYAAVKDVVAEM